MLRKFLPLMLSAAFGVFALSACGGGNQTNGNSSTTGNGNQSTTTTTTTTTASTPTSTTATSNNPATMTGSPAATTSPATTTANTGGEKIGIADCDDFLDKYEACVSDKVPAAQRAQYESTLKQWRDSWRQMAGNPQTKGVLAQACKMAADQARQSMTSYGCSF